MVGKLLEKFLRNKINVNVERQGLIKGSQHGFVREKFCLTNLIEFFKELTKFIDEGSAVDTVHIDFSKAFDMGDWSKRLEPMKSRACCQSESTISSLIRGSG